MQATWTPLRIASDKVTSKEYFYRLISRYLSVYIQPQNSVAQIDPPSAVLGGVFKNMKFLFSGLPPANPDFKEAQILSGFDELKKLRPDYIVLDGNVHFAKDPRAFLDKIREASASSTRLLIIHYSAPGRPAREELFDILNLSNFEPVFAESKIIFPVHVPFISDFVNRYLAPLPCFRRLGTVGVLVARPVTSRAGEDLAASVVVPARNESGNIENIVNRVPKMGSKDELIFVEGHSTDDTWSRIQEIKRIYGASRNIKIAQQDGKGKGDAVRKGFQIASGDILMILDADLTAPPETLPLFYRAVAGGEADFINGTRLVYPMEKGAMRFLNFIGNKFFARAVSFILGQKLTDTLCGTKVLSREHYERIAASRDFFGDFDPFGDFDLIFGASRMGLKIKEIPVNYKNRTYGTTNISRARDAVKLLLMLLRGAGKIKFV
jgi:hypothetical protein